MLDIGKGTCSDALSGFHAHVDVLGAANLAGQNIHQLDVHAEFGERLYGREVSGLDCSFRRAEFGDGTVDDVVDALDVERGAGIGKRFLQSLFRQHLVDSIALHELEPIDLG